MYSTLYYGAVYAPLYYGSGDRYSPLYYGAVYAPIYYGTSIVVGGDLVGPEWVQSNYSTLIAW